MPKGDGGRPPKVAMQIYDYLKHFPEGKAPVEIARETKLNRLHQVQPVLCRSGWFERLAKAKWVVKRS